MKFCLYMDLSSQYGFSLLLLYLFSGFSSFWGRVLCHTAYRISVPRPWQLKPWILTTRPPRNSHFVVVIVQLLSCVWLFATPWTAGLQVSLSFTISQSLLKLMPIELMMPSNHPLLPPLPTALNLPQHQGLFEWVGSSHQVAKVLGLQLQHQSFQ